MWKFIISDHPWTNGPRVRFVIETSMCVYTHKRATRRAQITYGSGTRIKGFRNAGCDLPLMRLR